VFKILVRIGLADIFFVSHWLPFTVSSTNMDSRKSAKISYYPHHDNRASFIHVYDADCESAVNYALQESKLDQ
jgi:hypothetical protein